MSQRVPLAPRVTNAELDRLLLKNGGFFWLDENHNEWIKGLFKTILRRFDRHIAFAKTTLYADKPREIEFGLLSATKLNAFAYASHPVDSSPFDFIGINVGAIYTLLDTFQRILAHPENFPDVGDASKENPSRATIEYLSIDAIASDRIACIPNCSARNKYSFLLTVIALDFLFFHELSHLRNGHLEYFRQYIHLGHWSEAIGSCYNDSNVVTIQALEMDADCGGILLALNEAFTLKKFLAVGNGPLTTEEQEAFLAAFGSSRQAVRTVQFAVYVLFRLFDTECDWSRQSIQDHPQPSIRMFWIMPTLHEIFKTRDAYEYGREEFAVDGIINWRSAETACANIKGGKIDVRMIESVVRSPQGLEYIKQLNARWQSIRPHLELHKRGGVLAE